MQITLSCEILQDHNGAMLLSIDSGFGSPALMVCKSKIIDESSALRKEIESWTGEPK